ncbi:MAG: ankyrin repeat domain-containing protein [Elusimicrobiota bacterium]
MKAANGRNPRASLVPILPILLALTACSPPLIKAARGGDAQAARAALDSGADPNVRGGDRRGQTPLMIAAVRADLPLARLLLDRGAKADRAGGGGETPLMRAADHGSLEVVRLLIEKGADVDAKGVQGTTALHYAVQSNQPEIVRLILDHGADVNATDDMRIGRTPLGIAAYFGRADLARLLLERGADSGIACNNGRVPHREALWRGHIELAKMIKNFRPGVSPASGPPKSEASLAAADEPSYRLARNPDAWAVVVGIGRYAGLPEDAFAERDAQSVRAHLLAMGYPDSQVVLLTDLQATRAGLVKTLETRLPGKVNARSTVFFYFAGYGSADPKTGRAYLLPLDADSSFLADTAYPLERLYDKLSAMGAAQVIVALDCGFAGGGGRSVHAPGGSSAAAVGLGVGARTGIAVLTAAGPSETASVLPDAGHGLFTYHFLRGLNGEARDKEGAVTLSSLAGYLSGSVADAARARGREQHPQLVPIVPTSGFRFR